MSLCTNCGNPIPEEARFCPVCGTPAVSEPPESEIAEGIPVDESVPPEEERPLSGEVSSGGWYDSSETGEPAAPTAAPVYVNAKPAIGNIFDFYRKAFSVLAKKP